MSSLRTVFTPVTPELSTLAVLWQTCQPHQHPQLALLLTYRKPDQMCSSSRDLDVDAKSLEEVRLDVVEICVEDKL